jgi:hypothetical protein
MKKLLKRSTTNPTWGITATRIHPLRCLGWGRYNEQPRGGTIASRGVGGSGKHLRLPVRCRPQLHTLFPSSETKSPKKHPKPKDTSNPGPFHWTTYTRTGHASSAFWLLCLFSSLVAVCLASYPTTSSSLQSSTTAGPSDYYAAFFAPQSSEASNRLRIPPTTMDGPVLTRSLRMSTIPTVVALLDEPPTRLNPIPRGGGRSDYGSISYHRATTPAVGTNSSERLISPEDDSIYEAHRDELLASIDGREGMVTFSRTELASMDKDCRDIPWVQYRFPTCNTVHELVIARPTSATDNYVVSYIRYVETDECGSTHWAISTTKSADSQVFSLCFILFSVARFYSNTPHTHTPRRGMLQSRNIPRRVAAATTISCPR